MTVDIKKVLAMPPIEQFEWLLSEGIADDSLVRSQITNKIVPHWIKFELGHLAFRYRDKAIKENKEGWLRACYEVDNIAGDYKDGRIYNRNNGYTAEYNILKRSPIHWILAALQIQQKGVE